MNETCTAQHSAGLNEVSIALPPHLIEQLRALAQTSSLHHNARVHQTLARFVDGNPSLKRNRQRLS